MNGKVNIDMKNNYGQRKCTLCDTYGDVQL